MRLQRHLTGKPPQSGSAVAIGNFDGMHLGHQDLLKRMHARASADGFADTAVLFEPQPLEFLRSDTAPPRLMGLRDKLSFINRMGIEHVLCLRFNDELAHMRAQQFVRTVLVDELAVKVLYVGSDFHFGYRREGDTTLLRQLGMEYGFELVLVPQFMHNEVRVSSTDVRKALAAGMLEQARELLGHNISIRGRVVAGVGRGRELGVPTLNMEPRHCPPISGIFASRMHIDGNTWQGASYLGMRPQFADRTEPVLETHLFATPPPTVTGKWVRVELLTRLRPDSCFSGGVEELLRNISLDLAGARKWHQEHPA